MKAYCTLLFLAILMLVLQSKCYAQTDSLKTQKHLTDSRFMLGSGVILLTASIPTIAMGALFFRNGVQTYRYGETHDFRPSARVATSIGAVAFSGGIALIVLGWKGYIQSKNIKMQILILVC